MGVTLIVSRFISTKQELNQLLGTLKCPESCFLCIVANIFFKNRWVTSIFKLADTTLDTLWKNYRNVLEPIDSTCATTPSLWCRIGLKGPRTYSPIHGFIKCLQRPFYYAWLWSYNFLLFSWITKSQQASKHIRRSYSPQTHVFPFRQWLFLISCWQFTLCPSVKWFILSQM